MRSLGTSDHPTVRAVSSVIEKVSSRTRARQFVRVMNRMGASPAAVLPYVQDSPNFANRRFEGEEPSLRPRVRAQTHALVAAIRVRDRGKPAGTVPVVPAEPPQQPGELAVTWYGHATTVLEIDGARFLIDPVFSERVSPIRHVGPRRMHPVPGSIADIPSIDAVLVSHDHYDHLDQPSIVRLEETHRPHYVVPLGVNAHLLAWGVPEQRITALDWRDETEVAGIRLTCTEARHNSGRGLVDSQTLWAGWALRGPRHSAYFAGRLRHVEALRRHRGGPRPLRPDAHARRRVRPVLARHPHGPRAGPRGAPRRQPHRRRDARPDRGRGRGGRRVHRGATTASTPPGGTHEEGERTETTRTVPTAARESLLVPVHWATFNLSMHWWAEPVRRIRRGAAQAHVPVAFPRVGERVDLSSGDADAVAAAHSEPWWEQCAAPEDRD